MKTSFKIRFPSSTKTGPRREELEELWGMGVAISPCLSLRAQAAWVRKSRRLWGTPHLSKRGPGYFPPWKKQWDPSRSLHEGLTLSALDKENNE
ncbi:hypothetical protein HPG69_002240, partial [Diceros bicornis minor]